MSDSLIYWRDEAEKLSRQNHELEATIATLRQLLIERDGGVHDYDCKIHNPGIKMCTCYHDEAMAFLAQEKSP